MNKRTFFSVLLFVLAGTFARAQEPGDAASIVEKSRNRINAATTSVRYKMVRAAKNGALSEQVMDQYSKKDAGGNNRMLIVFQEPASARGSRFLTLENRDRDNDQWIFLPALRSKRRIAGAEGQSSFMGTDFSYDDISSADRAAALDNHKTLGEENLKNRNCYVIESIPKDPDYQYSKMIQWIDKETFVTWKIELYDKKGNHAKLLEILELREVQGRQAPIVTRMTNVSGGTFTSLNTLLLKYDDPIPEGVFTERYLETGRP